MPFDADPAVSLGSFVQAAYTMYGNDPEDLTPPKSADFPVGYELTAWVQMQDFFIFGTTGLTFYGFIAHRMSEPSVPVLAIRGTANVLSGGTTSAHWG